jgi:signal transduction histidine kinase
MPFTVSARTILQLGAELISSDAVAFYELIKNAFDAKSKDVRIHVIVRIAADDVAELEALIDRWTDDSVNEEAGLPIQSNTRDQIVELRDQILSKIIMPSTSEHETFRRSVSQYREQVSRAADAAELKQILKESNYIDFIDTGEGMTLDDLSNIYLTIGTPVRLRQRERILSSAYADRDVRQKVPLGEKGVGRLSAMRLGKYLRVQTSKAGESNYNLLEIDWDVFAQSADDLLEDIEVAPVSGGIKPSPSSSGTLIHISDLESSWTKDKLQSIAVEEFSRLIDPFGAKPVNNLIRLRFNGSVVVIPAFEQLLFDAAHAVVTAEFRITDTGPCLTSKMEYIRFGRQGVFQIDAVHLGSITRASSSVLNSLGPFTVKFYWFNRRSMTAIDGIGDQRAVRSLINKWAGGLMVFRDGFRVNPYGSGDDDWLQLDRVALSAPGYKINRSQIIGKVDVSIVTNPHLVDQTNREGIRDNAEKRAFVAILKHLVTVQFRQFMDSVEAEKASREPVRLADVERQVAIHQSKVDSNLDQLRHYTSGIAEAQSLIAHVEAEVVSLKRIMDEVKVVAESYDQGRSQLIHLAGIGLMVEIITHELSRATLRTINSVSALEEQGELPAKIVPLLGTLDAQLRTLHKRLRVLDPLDTNARQTKETFDLIAWVKEIVESHSDQFERHNIDWQFIVEPIRRDAYMTVRAVKGMFVQILENLISNSVYWLTQEQKVNPNFVPSITVTVRTNTRQILCSDNGPGVPLMRRETVFDSFFTTKPPGEGKGLGLFVSREIASYHGATLELSEETLVRPGFLNTFVLTLGNT